MKRYQTAVCALALMLACVPLAACGSQNSADNDWEEPVPPVEEPLPPNDVIDPDPELPDAVIPEIPENPQPPATPEQPKPEETPDPLPKRKDYVIVRTNGLNVRSGAGTNYSSLGTVENGVLLELVKKTGNWYETRYRGRTAYVSADSRYTSLTSLEAGGDLVESVITEGLKVLGVPYVYGAVRLHDGKGNFLNNFTDSKFDCSSLMQYMFYHGAKILLNTTTRTQVSQGKEVKKQEIQRGDLMFFTNATRKDKVGIERIGHVALYLGDNYILHTASDYAKIEQISQTRWSYYITSRRVF